MPYTAANKTNNLMPCGPHVWGPWPYCHAESFLPTYPSSCSSDCWFEQPSLFCAFMDLSEQGLYPVCKCLSFILVHWGLPVYSERLPSPAHSCRPCFFLTEVADYQWWSVDSPAPFDTNIQHWLE